MNHQFRGYDSRQTLNLLNSEGRRALPPASWWDRGEGWSASPPPPGMRQKQPLAGSFPGPQPPSLYRDVWPLHHFSGPYCARVWTECFVTCPLLSGEQGTQVFLGSGRPRPLLSKHSRRSSQASSRTFDGLTDRMM